MNSSKPRPKLHSGKTTAGTSVVPVALITAVLVALVSFSAFLPALANQFVNWDDYETLLDNSRYRGLAWSHLRWMFTTFYMGHYQPLSWLSFALDYLVWGTDPVGYHLTNLILHALNAALFFFLARLLLVRALAIRDRNRQFAITLGAALAALLFSLHPLRVESVVWATERRDVLSGLFYFAALYCYVSADQSDQSRRRLLGVSVLLYALSLFAKGTAMTLPAVLLLLDVYPLERLPGAPSGWFRPKYRAVLWEKLPYIILAAVFAVVAITAQQNTGALRPVQQYFLSYRLGQAFYGFCFYLWKSFVPLHLSPLYELPFDFDAWMPLFYLCGFAVLAITVTLYCLRRRWPALLASWLYYLVLLVPVAGLAQSGPQLVADRYSYLSCLSWALLAGGGLARFMNSAGGVAARSRLVVAPFAAVVLMTLAVLSWQQSKVWRDTTTLWRRVIAVAPKSSIAYYNLARTYEDQGVFPQSLQYYRRALENNPLNADAQYNLARLLAKRGMVAEAIAGYRRALQIRPKDADAHNNLGLLIARRGDVEAATVEFHAAIKIDPQYAKAFFNLGRLSAERGELEKALDNYRQALARDPNQIEILLGLAETLGRLKKFDEAEIHLQKAVSLYPNSPDAHTSLARVLAAQGRKVEAERHYQDAIRLLQLRSGSQKTTPEARP
jgi:protein O-mannosyl-transferase